MSDTQRTDRAQTIIGSVTFCTAVGFVLLGAFTGDNMHLIIGAVVALAGIVASITIEARRKVTHVQDSLVPPDVVPEAAPTAHV